MICSIECIGSFAARSYSLNTSIRRRLAANSSWPPFAELCSSVNIFTSNGTPNTRFFRGINEARICGTLVAGLKLFFGETVFSVENLVLVAQINPEQRRIV